MERHVISQDTTSCSNDYNNKYNNQSGKHFISITNKHINSCPVQISTNNSVNIIKNIIKINNVILNILFKNINLGSFIEYTKTVFKLCTYNMQTSYTNATILTTNIANVTTNITIKAAPIIYNTAYNLIYTITTYTVIVIYKTILITITAIDHFIVHKLQKKQKSLRKYIGILYAKQRRSIIMPVVVSRIFMFNLCKTYTITNTITIIVENIINIFYKIYKNTIFIITEPIYYYKLLLLIIDTFFIFRNIFYKTK